MSDTGITYISTSGMATPVDFCHAVAEGVAPGNGLYFPREIPHLPDQVIQNLHNLAIPEIGNILLRAFIPHQVLSDDQLTQIASDAFNFPIPLVEVEPGIYSLELFHGPTLAFKDIGARFLGRVLPYCMPGETRSVVLVATSGDTGGAVAHGMMGVEGIQVVILYPHGKVSPLQEKQFASLGGNVSALAVDGVFDDCQTLVKQAFADVYLKSEVNLTSANSINIARWLPQATYYFVPMQQALSGKLAFSVPSGNFGNLTAGILAARMGIRDTRFIAACNANDVVPKYLQSGQYQPRPSIQTVANAMDVGDPSNFVRLQALFSDQADALRASVEGYSLDDQEIRSTIKSCLQTTGYLLDPHGAVGYAALKSSLRKDETGIFLATAHPAKFAEVYDDIGIPRPTHPRLEALRDSPVLTHRLSANYEELRDYLQAHFAGSK